MCLVILGSIMHPSAVYVNAPRIAAVRGEQAPREVMLLRLGTKKKSGDRNCATRTKN